MGPGFGLIGVFGFLMQQGGQRYAVDFIVLENGCVLRADGSVLRLGMVIGSDLNHSRWAVGPLLSGYQ